MYVKRTFGWSSVLKKFSPLIQEFSSTWTDDNSHQLILKISAVLFLPVLSWRPG